MRLESSHSNLYMLWPDDGTLRIYHPSSHKVLKAIRGFGSEILSVASSKGTQGDLGTVWLASGRCV
jgi:hypothetical protein